QALFAHQAVAPSEALAVGDGLGEVDHRAVEHRGRLARADAFDEVAAVAAERAAVDPIGEAAAERVGEHHAHRRGALLQEAANASPTPVLPAVASTMVPPAASAPRASASSTMARAMRSLTLPPGFKCSHLASSGTGSPAPTRASSTSGVSPIASSTDGTRA